MSYTIIKTNQSTLCTVLDGTIDSPTVGGNHSSLTLIGRNYPNYGALMADNLIALLENFSYGTAPSAPLVGQLWWNSSTRSLNIYSNSSASDTVNGYWKSVGGAQAATSAPSIGTAGDLWWDQTNSQLYVYSGSAWVLVGPAFPVSHKTGAIVETLNDASSNTYYVISLYNDNTRTGIISKDTFTPYPALSNFTVIQPGYNLAAGETLWGTANNASYLGTVPAANYLRTDINNVAQGSLAIQSNVGIQIGSLGNYFANIHSTSGSAQIWNTQTGANISLHVSTPGGIVKALTAYGQDGLIYVAGNPTSALGVATKQYVDGSFTNTVLTGVPTAPTMPGGTANTAIATTAFVINNSGFFTNKIYQGNSSFEIDDTGSGTATLSIDSTSVLTASQAGVNLLSGATAITQSDSYNGTGNSAVATTQFVKNATQWWGGSAKFVSTSAPNAGVNDAGSHDGDFWFQYTA